MPNIDDDQAVQALRDGLRAQPVPAVSPDFDARVLAALAQPDVWWRRWWQPARPVLVSAFGSLTVTLILLHWTLTAPLTPPTIPTSLASAPAQIPSIDSLLDRPNLCAASLTQDWNSPAPVPLPINRHPEPRRHADAHVAPPLIA